MSDLIERQAAIDAVEESRRLNHHQDGKEACAHEYEHRHFLKILFDLPSAQQEIIHCKDCRFVWKSVEGSLWCDRLSGCFHVVENDFCSFAKGK